MMKWVIILYFFTLDLSSFKTGADEGVFGDGRYRVDFTSKKLADYEIEIIGNKYIKHLPNLKKEGTISRSDAELYYFDDTADTADTITEVKDVLFSEMRRSFGEERLEVKKAGRNKIIFRITYQANLHLTLNEGVFIKKRGRLKKKAE